MTSVRVRALAVGGALVLAAAMTARIDVARAGGGIKGDEATFVGLAASAGYDGDLTYGPADYQRFRRWYGSGPEGIFLKRGSDGEIYFGKAYLYGLLAAPFARVGGLSGLLIFNLGLLALVIAAGYAWLRPMSRAAAALAFSAAFVAASVAPLYAFWLTADVLNFALVFLAFAAAVPAPGARPRSLPLRLLGFVLLAGAIFSKPLNLPLALALAMGAGSGRRTSPVGALAGIGAMVAVLFAVNAAWTGELNYQGGERKTFYGSFPYDESGQTFETSGIGMTTNTVQTPVGAEGRASSVVANLWYFVTGRHFGLVPFGWPWLVAVVWWLVGERRKMAWQWALMAGAAAAAVGTIVWMPYTWSGGGGPVGNRYFLSVAAALFFLVPRPQSVMPGAVAALGLLFVAPSLASPFVVAKQPWRATATPFFDILPLELTGASDFPVILDQRRGRIPQGRAPTVFVALLDERSGMGRNGWIAVDPGVATSLLVRSPERLDGVTIGVKSTSACDVGLASGGARERAALGPNDRRDLELSPPQTFSRDSFVFVLTVDSTACDTPIEVALQARTRRPGDADGVGRAGRHSRFVRDVGLASGIAVLR